MRKRTITLTIFALGCSILVTGVLFVRPRLLKFHGCRSYGFEGISPARLYYDRYIRAWSSNAPSTNTAALSGQVVDCNGRPMDDVHVIFQSEHQTLYAVTDLNGAFYLGPITPCDRGNIKATSMIYETSEIPKIALAKGTQRQFTFVLGSRFGKTDRNLPISGPSINRTP